MPETAALIKEITEELKKAQHEQFKVIEPQIAEAIKTGKSVAELSEKMAQANTDVSKCIETLEALDKLVKVEAEAQTKREKDHIKRIDLLESKLGEEDGGIQVYKSIGQQYIEKFNQEQFDRGFNESTMAPMKIKLDARWIWAPIGKSISTAAASAGTLADSLRLPGVITQPEPALVVQAMIATRTIENRQVDYVRELVFTDLTATVAETTDDTSLVNKPKGDITFELITDTMNTIAQWIPASRQSLRYSTRVDLLNYIDGRLRDRVLLELERQALTGDGTGSNFDGIIPNATAYNRGFSQIQGAAPTEVDTLRRAVTQLQLANYFPTGIILHPSDWEEIDLNKDTQLRYILAGSPQGVNSRTLWGVPVMVSNEMVSTEFLIGDFRATTLELMIGNALMVRISESHGDFFISNMIAILAEMDGLLAFYRPEAIINGELELAAEIDEKTILLLRADPRLLKQILFTMPPNAIKFTPPGGKVTIRAWHNRYSGYVIQVEDNGIGMALNDIPKALSRFGQIDSALGRKYEGTGLGLPLIRSLAELHDGSLDLQSEVGAGTTVTVRFPAGRLLAQSPEPAEPAAAIPLARAGGAKFS